MSQPTNETPSEAPTTESVSIGSKSVVPDRESLLAQLAAKDEALRRALDRVETRMSDLEEQVTPIPDEIDWQSLHGEANDYRKALSPDSGNEVLKRLKSAEAKAAERGPLKARIAELNAALDNAEKARDTALAELAEMRKERQSK